MTNFGCDNLGDHGVVVADVLESRVQTFVIKHNEDDNRNTVVLLILLQLLVKDISSSFLRNFYPLWLLNLDSKSFTCLDHSIVNVLSKFVLSWSFVDNNPFFEVQILSILNLKSS